jgi:hypothetical protein
MKTNKPISKSQFASPISTRWLWLSILAAILAIGGNIIGLAVKRIYADLTPAFLPQALAQDIASLAIVTPLWLVVAVLALRGSLRAYLLWLGVLTFTVYNYVIYAFSVPFGPLFLLWVAVLGLSIYALIGGVATVDHEIVASRFVSKRTVQVVAWFLIIASILFYFIWLSEDIPALLSATRPQSLVELGLPTNPVHILDLGFFLPAVVATGVMILRRKSLGYTFAPPFIVFLILTGMPILITPVVQSVRGETAAWGVMVPIGTLTVLCLGLLVWLLSTIRPAEKLS